MRFGMAQTERMRISWHPIALGLALVVGLGVIRAGGDGWVLIR
jgi:hypothetical protein